MRDVFTKTNEGVALHPVYLPSRDKLAGWVRRHKMRHSHLQSFKLAIEYGTLGVYLDDFPDDNKLLDFEYRENQADTYDNSRQAVQQDMEPGKEWPDVSAYCFHYAVYPRVINVLYDKVIVNNIAMRRELGELDAADSQSERESESEEDNFVPEGAGISGNPCPEVYQSCGLPSKIRLHTD